MSARKQQREGGGKAPFVPITSQAALRMALAGAETVGQFYAAWKLARGVAESLWTIDPDDKDAQAKALHRAAWDVEDAAVAGMIRATSAYPSEVGNKLHVYRDMIERGDHNGNSADALLASAESDLTGLRMDQEREVQQEQDRLARASEKRARD